MTFKEYYKQIFKYSCNTCNNFRFKSDYVRVTCDKRPDIITKDSWMLYFLISEGSTCKYYDKIFTAYDFLVTDHYNVTKHISTKGCII